MQPQSLTIFPATQKLLRCETDLMDLSIKAGEKRTCIRQFRLVIGCLRPPTAHQSRFSRRRRRVVVSREVDTCMRSHWTCDDRHVGVEVNRQITSYELTSDINATSLQLFSTSTSRPRGRIPQLFQAIQGRIQWRIQDRIWRIQKRLIRWRI